MAIARTSNGRPFQDGQQLDDHLRAVGKQCATHLGSFGLGEGAVALGLAAGLLHDAGKYTEAFQERMRALAEGREPERTERANHAGTGAQIAWELGTVEGEVLAAAIAAHHAGLADAEIGDEGNGSGLCDQMNHAPSPERAQLDAKRRGEAAEWESLLVDALPVLPVAQLRGEDEEEAEEAPRRRQAFFARMLLSALVDADRLDARSWDARLAGEEDTDPKHPDFRALGSALDQHLTDLPARGEGSQGPERRRIQEYRTHVLDSCRKRAEDPPGVFHLNVPTGGGKTLSSLAFALKHAAHHSLRRVIVAIPFTSIIEQTATVYREALGDLSGVLLEHHSNASFEIPEKDDEKDNKKGSSSPEALRRLALRRLATENWDVPLIVTTNVQLLESLHAHHPSRVRKIHNLARSVIIFDEPQVFPPQLLAPIVDAIDELVEMYGCSVVLSSATQPALTGIQSSRVPQLRSKVRAIVGDVDAPKMPPRVVAEWFQPDAPLAPVPWANLASAIAKEPSALAIVHRRADARELFEAVEEELERAGSSLDGLLHLSAAMCPEHRRERIKTIRERLRDQLPCRVISTQVVEAGVDLDFPVVYRALAGVDSLAQAAGRCNREGRLGERAGRLVMFLAQSDPPPGVLAHGLAVTRSIICNNPDGPAGFDPLHDDTVEAYFRQLYGLSARSKPGLGGQFRGLSANWNFREIDAAFQLIPSATHTVVVPWPADRVDQLVGKARDLLAIPKSGPRPSKPRGLLKQLQQLQQHSVSVYDHTFRELDRACAVEPLDPAQDATAAAADHDAIWVIRTTHQAIYHPSYGLPAAGPFPANPEALVV